MHANELPTLPKAQDFMVTQIISVGPDFSLTDVMNILVKEEVSSVPVLEKTDNGQKIVGIISEKDCMRSFCNGFYYSFTKENYARNIMQQNLIVADTQMDLLKIEELFDKHNLRLVPVIDGENRLVGIISRHDLLIAAKNYCQKVSNCANKDTKIPEKITSPTQLHNYIKYI